MSDNGRVLAFLVGALFGACIGSFLNVVIHRLPRNESLVHPGSRCYGCGTAVAWYDNIPIVSWLVLRGRCRWCGSYFSVRYLIGELTVALLCGAAMWFAFEQLPGYILDDELGATISPLFTALAVPVVWQAAIAGAALLIFVWYLYASAVIDLDHTIIPDELSKPMQLAAPLLALCLPINLKIGRVPEIWFQETSASGMIRWAPILGLQELVTVVIGAVAVLLLSLPLARWIYGRFCPPSQRWRDEDHRAFRIGVLWFVAASVLHLLFFAAFVMAVKYFVIAPQRLIDLTNVATHYAQSQLGSLAGWCSLYAVGLLGTVLFRRNAMGFGDVKFLAPIGAFVGPMGVLYVFGLAALIGSLVGLPMRLLGKGREIPFGPFLAAGAVVTVLYGADIHSLFFPT